MTTRKSSLVLGLSALFLISTRLSWAQVGRVKADIPVIPNPVIVPAIQTLPPLNFPQPPVTALSISASRPMSTVQSIRPLAPTARVRVPARPSPVMQSVGHEMAAFQGIPPSNLGDRSGSLNRFYSGSGSTGQPPSGPVGGSFKDSIESFVEKAKRRFYPKLSPGREAPVFIPDALFQTEGVPTDEEIQKRVELSPLSNEERFKAIRQIYLDAGAKPEQMIAQKIGNREAYNLIVTKPGKTDRVIVIGGHYDKVRAGKGTIDNWTGATMVANVFQALKDVELEHTIVFMAFGLEEEGMVGSKYYVRSLPKDQLAKIDRMLNLDTMAVDGTFSWPNGSDRPLLDLAIKVAQEEKLALKEQPLSGGDSDQTSFRRAGVPAMMLYGASPSVIWDIIHTDNDNIAAFSLPHYKNAYLLSRALMLAMDRLPNRPASLVLDGFLEAPLNPWWLHFLTSPRPSQP
ncbi:MAG: M20/M25/M40 family metallo-hydrolase [Elusimicrobia bacterium]|nr:M20/M25/M40 family metallo-hydrolase [Elusimicrobiota bacterium]